MYLTIWLSLSWLPLLETNSVTAWMAPSADCLILSQIAAVQLFKAATSYMTWHNIMGPQPSNDTRIYTKEKIKQTSSSVKRAQMDETILLKTSDGSIEASWKSAQRNMTPWTWIIQKKEITLSLTKNFLRFSKWQWHPQGKTGLYRSLQSPARLRVPLSEGKGKCWRTGQESNNNNSRRND